MFTFINDGSGTFTKTSSFYVLFSGLPYMSIGDLDGDGDLDLLLTTGIFKNDGYGNFTLTQNIGSNYGYVELGDFDGDGDLDFAVSNNGCTTGWVFKNNGTGNFTGTTQPTICGYNAFSVGDFDHDGDLDLALGNSSTVPIFKNNGSGVFSLSSTVAIYSTGHYDDGIVNADFDGDGDVDLAATSTTGNFVAILKNLNFTVTSTTPAANALSVSPTTTIQAHFSSVMQQSSFKDTSSFLVTGSVSGRHRGTFSFSSGDSVVTFTPTVAFKRGEVVTVDLTDKLLDTRGGRGATKVWQFTVSTTTSLGQFAAKVDYGTGSVPFSVFVSDVDGDGDGDIVVANQFSNTISVLKNNGDGIYQTKVDYGTGSAPFSVFVADVDGDGDGDIVVTNRDANTVSVLKNNGDGTFQTKVDYGTGSAPFSVLVSDVNGDGDGDIVVANYNSNTVSVFKNNGDGTFAAKVDYAAGSGPISVFVSDVDGDGDGDIVTANFGNGSGNTVSVLKNNGDGTFAAKVDYGTGGSPYSVFVADVDGDGDGDIVVANYNSNTVSVFKNNGDGTFAAKVDYTTGIGPQSVFVSDVDGDGDADIAAANSGSNTVSILKNVQAGIGGTVFNDLNGNGIKDNGEPGLAGWKVKLTQQSFASNPSGSRKLQLAEGKRILKDAATLLTDSLYTDASGNYTFNDLATGTYTVRQELQSSWIRTFPQDSDHYTVQFTQGQAVSGKDFGNFKLGSISGQKFNDINGNGAKDGADSGLANWLIRLSKSNVQIDSQLTTATGNYSFTNLGPGTYTVSERVEPDWSETYPLSPGTYTIALTSGDSLTGKDFYNYLFVLNSITVRKFRDRDGSFNTRDDLVAKTWYLRLYKDSVSASTLIKDTTASFMRAVNVQPGTYIAVESDSAGWTHLGKVRNDSAIQSSANADTFHQGASQAGRVDFINFHPNKIIVRKFSDHDGNFSTSNDRTRKQWHLTLYKGLVQPANKIGEVASAESLQVQNLGEGTYSAIEEDSTGWTHVGTILDGSGSASTLNRVDLTAGDGETHTVEFVNAHLGNLTLAKYLDQDGDFRTDGDRSPKVWGLKLYRDSVSQSTLVDSVVAASLTHNNLPEGNYIAVESDSAFPWSHIQTVLRVGALVTNIGGTQNQININLVGGQTVTAEFINFNRTRQKVWTGGFNCTWSDGRNWDPPSVPIPGDTIIVPDTAHCALIIPPCSSIGTIAIAGPETVKVQPGSSVYVAGDMNINGLFAVDDNDTSVITVCGNWNVNGNGKINPGHSTIVFPGSNAQSIKGKGQHFYKIKLGGAACVSCGSTIPQITEPKYDGFRSVLTQTANIKTNGNFTVDAVFDLNQNLDARGDTIFVGNQSSSAITGSGVVVRGTVQRSIQSGSTSMYRFESNKSFAQFNGSGNPSAVSMTTYPDTTPTDFGTQWEVISSHVNTSTRVVTADSVTHFSKWAIGRPRPRVLLPKTQGVADILPDIRRVYSIAPEGSNNFLATLQLRYDSSEVPVGVPEDSLVLLRLVGISSSVDVAKGWNMISVPVTVNDGSKSTLFSTATSNAFAFQAGAGYVRKDTLVNGSGYWLKFPSAQVISIIGGQLSQNSINVAHGWNMIGSISNSVAISSIASNPPNIVTSQFFGYKNGYTTSDSIQKGKAYWVKVNQSGQLILSASGAAALNKIRIVPTSELPPPPPDEEITNSKPPIPDRFALEQNYPNPFNPTTVIRYQIPEVSKVVLKIYNVLGQEVAKLVDEVEDAGYKSVDWNSANISSGIYFYRLEAAGVMEPSRSYSQTKKLILLK